MLTKLLTIVVLTTTTLDPEQLSVWKDPRFQRQFIESYKSEVDIEPTLTKNEREKMQKVLEHMAADEVDEAMTLLQKHAGEAALVRNDRST